MLEETPPLSRWLPPLLRERATGDGLCERRRRWRCWLRMLIWSPVKGALRHARGYGVAVCAVEVPKAQTTGWLTPAYCCWSNLTGGYPGGGARPPLPASGICMQQPPAQLRCCVLLFLLAPSLTPLCRSSQKPEGSLCTKQQELPSDSLAPAVGDADPAHAAVGVRLHFLICPTLLPLDRKCLHRVL